MIRMRKMLAETPSSPMELRMTALTVCSWCRTISPPAPRGLPCAASLGADHLLLAAVRLVVEGGSGTREIPLGPDDRHLASIMQTNEPGADLCTSGPDCGLMTKGWAVSRHASDVWQCWAMAMESTKLTVHECVWKHTFNQAMVLGALCCLTCQIWPACLDVSGETTGDWGQWGQWGHQCTFNCRLSRLCVIALILELIISQLCSSQEIREINGRRAKTCLTFRINGSCHQLSLSPQKGLSQPTLM